MGYFGECIEKAAAYTDQSCLKIIGRLDYSISKSDIFKMSAKPPHLAYKSKAVLRIDASSSPLNVQLDI